MSNIQISLYLTSELSMIIPLVVFCFIPVSSYIKDPAAVLFLKILAALASAFFTFFIVFLFSPTITATNIGQIILAAFMFLLYCREIRLPAFRLWFIYLTACLIGGYSYLVYHITDILLRPEGYYFDLYKPYSLLAQIIFECVAVIIFYIPSKKYLGWLAANYNEERIWRVVWIFPAVFTIFSYFLVPYNNSYMYLGRFMKMYFYLLILSFIVVLVLYVLFYKIALTMAEKSELLSKSAYLEVQVQQYHELQTHVQETRRLRHDFRHHLTAISEMLEHGHYEEALDFLHEYRTEVSAMPKLYCHSTALNAVLHHYESLYKSEGITPLFHIRISENTSINDVDFCVLLGNLLENALHGCRDFQQSPAQIDLNIVQTTPHIIVIQIRNPYSGKTIRQNAGFASTKHQGSGQGLKSVHMIAEKYSGQVCITDKDGIFTVQVLLNI